MRRLILAEPGLRGETGHEQAHARMLAAECARRGLAFEVLVSADAEDSIVSALSARKTFIVSVDDRPKSGGSASALLAWRSWSRQYRRDFAAALDHLGVGPDDLLLLNTVKIAVLDGFAGWLTGRASNASPAFAVILRLDADEGLPGGRLTRLSRWLYRRVLGKLHGQLGKRLLVATDTRLIGEDFERLIGRPIASIPLPIEVPQPDPPRPVSASTHLVFPSSARGRGFHLLPDALAARLRVARGSPPRSGSPTSNASLTRRSSIA